MKHSKEQAYNESLSELEFGEFVGPMGIVMRINTVPMSVFKPVEVVECKIGLEDICFTYYVEGTGKEMSGRILLSELIEWAIKTKVIFKVWEIPVYQGDEEYVKICPPTSEEGTAKEINDRREREFVESIPNKTEILEQFLSYKKSQNEKDS